MFHQFFDDAAVFPPGLAPLEEAVAKHIARNKNPEIANYIGPLVLPADSVAEAIKLANNSSLRLAVVATVGAISVDWVRQYPQIVGLEFKIDPHLSTEDNITRVAQFSTNFPHLDIFLELSAQAVTEDVLAAMAAHSVNLKFRTGGITSDLFPSSEDVIRVIALALQAGIQFKFTAGLHRAMRYVDATTGFSHFGFANIAAAIQVLKEGASKSIALEVLNSDDPTHVAAVISSPEASWKQTWGSFGTCSVTEPAETLSAMGLFPASLVTQFDI